MTAQRPPRAITVDTVADPTRREQILRTAGDVMARSGYVGTSLKDIAAACGIQAGSLYHHFESKEALAAELIGRYQEELDAIGRAALADIRARLSQPMPRLLALMTAIAECAVTHRAALQLTYHRPAPDANWRVIGLAGRPSESCLAALDELLSLGVAGGAIRKTLDPAVMAAQVCEMMLHVGLVSLQRYGAADVVAATFYKLLLTGVAQRAPTDRQLDRSAAFSVSNGLVVAMMAAHDAPPSTRRAVVEAAARVEFSRLGHDAATIRDVAAVAGLSNWAVYQEIESKEELLGSIMRPFYLMLENANDAVYATDSTVTEKLDAIVWFGVNAHVCYREEFQIQRAWLRVAPPEYSAYLDRFQHRRIRQLRALLNEGLRTGEIRSAGPSTDVFAACIRDLLWVPGVETTAAPLVVLRYARESLLRGIGTPRAKRSFT